jgi:hypothetical protein
MDALRKKYEDRLEIFTIGGVNDKVHVIPEVEEDTMRAIFERSTLVKKLSLPAVYDMDLYRQFKAWYAPTVVWIDDRGMVQAVTSSVNEHWIAAFLEGRPFRSEDVSVEGLKQASEHPYAYDYHKDFLVDNNGGKSDDFLYRSLIAAFNNESVTGPILPSSVDQYSYFGKLEGVGSLLDFYKLAYLGRIYNFEDCYVDTTYNQAIYELRDNTKFTDFSYSIPRKNYFWYSLFVPPRLGKRESLMAIMQHDLETFFGYKGKVETRVLPYWSVTLSDEAKAQMASNGGEAEVLGDWYTRMGARNITVNRYLNAIFHMTAPYLGSVIPIINETGMTKTIDVPVIDVDLSNFKEIKKVLSMQGFTLEKTKKEFKVLVISDATLPIVEIDSLDSH